MNTTKPEIEKVGVLLVHGVGEQCQFEHLEGEARNIATTLRKSAAQTNRENVAIRLRELVAKTTDKNIKAALKTAVKKINQGDIAKALKDLAFPFKKDYIAELQKLADEIKDNIELKKILVLAAKNSTKENIVRIIEELVTETKDRNFIPISKELETKINELETRIKNENITPIIEALVDQIPDLTKFELVELAAKNLANKAQVVQIAVNSFPSAAFGSEQETWHDGSRSPVMVEVYDEENEQKIRITQIYFHQVWWADLDEPTNLGSEIRFWLWGLSLWTIKGKFKTGLPGSGRMDWPNNGQKTIDCWARASLFWVSLVILLILPVLSLLKFVLRGLLDINIPRPDILAQFVGDVKLFQQEKRIGKGPLQDLGLPPRVTLRRRMIRGLVEMALRRYHRWYILAHSQGTVLAFNGIMETAQSLPNYLSKELWMRCSPKSPLREAQPNYLSKELWRRCRLKSPIRTAQTEREKLTDDEKRKMQPSFPSWRDKDYILDRRVLFKNFRGLLTYGSPLSKFAVLWPAIVPLNKDSHVFHKDFQWLNVYDPTDPVAGETQPFQSQPSQSDQSPAEVTTSEFSEYKAAKPIDFAYKANRFHLLSHLEYLTFSQSDRPWLIDVLVQKFPVLSHVEDFIISRQGDRTRLVDIVANWLLEGNLTVNAEKGSLTIKNKNDSTLIKSTVKRGDPGWPNSFLTNFYKGLRVTTWLFAALVIGSLLSVIISAVPQLSSFFQPITSFVLNLVSPWLQLSLMPPWLKLIFTAFLGGISYILLAAIVVLFTGIVVKLVVKDLGKL